MNIFDHINKQAALSALVVIIFLAGFFFYYLGGASTPSSGVSEVDSAGLDATLGKELLSALARLRSTKFDMTIFTDPVFAGLKDFGVEIAPQPVGRRNPFAIFEGGAGAAAAPAKSASAAASALPKKSAVPSTAGATPKTTPSGFDLQ